MLLEKLLQINPIYLLLYFMVGGLVFCSYKYKRKEPLYISIMFLILFSGFRYNAGADYFSYVNKMLHEKLECCPEQLSSLNYIEYISRQMMLLARFFHKPWIFFLLSAMCYVLGVSYGLKRLKLFNGLAVFLLTTFVLSFLSSFGVVRQYSAIGIGFLSWIFFYEKKYLYAFILLVIAYFLHFSAVIWFLPLLLLLFLLLKKEYPFWSYILLITVAFFFVDPILLVLQKIPNLEKYVIRMINFEYAVNGHKIFIGLLFVFCVSSFFQYYFVKNKPILMNYVQNMVVLGLAFYSLFLTYGEQYSRISYHFEPFFIVWNTLLYQSIEKEKYKKLFLVYILGISTFFYFATLYFSQDGTNGDFLNNYEFSIGKY